MQTEFIITHPSDLGVVGRVFVIPLPRGRALRIGGHVRAICKVGPRRYQVRMTANAQEDLARITRSTIDDVRINLADSGIEFEPLPAEVRRANLRAIEKAVDDMERCHGEALPGSLDRGDHQHYCPYIAPEFCIECLHLHNKWTLECEAIIGEVSPGDPEHCYCTGAPKR